MTLTKFSDFKKQMKDYFITAVDAEEGETFSDWFGALCDALEEEKSIIVINGKKYVKN